ncbi:MAG: YdbL family protein [Devosia sp.]|nr:YdbL family protein [Devosia sp.]
MATTLLLVAALAPGFATAQSTSAKALVDAAKAAGKVGEQADGLLGFVTAPADPALQAAVAEINAGRRRVYEETAQRNGVTGEVAAVAAFKVLRDTKLKPGDYYKDVDGIWRRK